MRPQQHDAILDFKIIAKQTFFLYSKIKKLLKISEMLCKSLIISFM